MMKRHLKLMIVTGIILCIGITSVFFMGKPDINTITEQKGYRILEQSEKSIEITINKEDLPIDADFEKGISFDENDIIVYQTETTTIYVESIQYANEGNENLYINFNCTYDLPRSKQVTIVMLPYFVNVEEGGTPSYTFSVESGSKKVEDGDKVFEDAVSLHGNGSAEKFSVYLKTDVYKEAKKEISFTLNGFYDMTYVKNKLTM